VRGEGGAWLIERQPQGARWRPGIADADVNVTITGSAQSLLLVLTRRLPLGAGPADVRIDGDGQLAQHWVDHTAHVSG
jgi:hypothetical protein